MNYIQSAPSTPEEFVCATLEIYYETIEAVISAALLAPEQVARLMKSAVVALEKMVYPSLLVLVEEAENGLISMCTLLNSIRQSDSNDGSGDWCRILFNCQAFIEIILSPSMRGLIVSMMPFVSDEDKIRLTTDYDAFATFVCKMSLADVLNAMIAAASADVFKKIEWILEKYKGIQLLSSILDEYDSAMRAAYIYEVLTEYDKFTLCAFTVCDFGSRSASSKQQVLERLYLTQDGVGVYMVDQSVGFIASCSKVERDVNTRITDLQTALRLGSVNGLDGCDFVASSIAPRVARRAGETSGLARLIT